MKPIRNRFVLTSLLTPLISGGLNATLVHHYKFDETSVTYAEDAVGGIYAGVGSQVTMGQPGRIGSSFRLPATANNPNSRVTLPSTVVPGAEFSMTAFVSLAAAANGQHHLISGNNGAAGRWSLAVNLNGGTAKLLWFHNGGIAGESYYTGFDFNNHVNKWVHVGITRSATGETKLWVNGLAQAIGTSLGALAITDIGIGMRPNAAQYQFNGRIDDVRFYNNALTDLEMTSLAQENDIDGDDLPDSWEVTHFINNGEDPVADRAAILARQNGAGDPDADSSDNLNEYLKGTLPLNPDSDGDGIHDGYESNTGTWVSATSTGTNPLKADTDEDGLPDGHETNSGNWISSTNTGTHPLKADSDGDGLLDSQENNTGTYVSPTSTGTNPNSADTDGDSFGDYLEISRSSNPVNGSVVPGTSSSTPLISLDAASLSSGELLSSWANSGTLGRSFDGETSPEVTTVAGVKGVTFYGTETLTGPVAPPNLTGASKRTVQAWIFNPTASTEETVVSWGRRDGGTGSNSALMHGTDPAFGAVGNWGTPDMGWGPNAPSITSNVKIGSWTYIVYTYDGGGTNVGNVYSNGNLANTELLGLLATWAVDNGPYSRPLPIRLAAQNSANGTVSAAGQKGSLTIAKLRVHDRVVPESELGFNDTDGDGMKDWYEEFYGLNKLVNDSNADGDSDGLTNLQEHNAGTNPSISDTDGDGLPDGWEITNFGNQTANPWDDPDHDGSVNEDEYAAVRGLRIHRDGNGGITSITPFTGASDPNDRDSQPDADNDGLPDGWEMVYFWSLSEGKTGDFDSDGFNNEVELLAGSDPSDPLSTPSDTDGDSLPDAWEILHFGNLTAQTGNGDADLDGSKNSDEQQAGTDPNDPDSQPNTDGDGLPDGYEYLHFGSLSEGDSGDFDNDTYNNLAEYTAGSNPARTKSTPANVDATTHVAVATLAGLEEYNVSHGVWSHVRQICPISGGFSGLTFHNGLFYATTVEANRRVVSIHPSTGAVTELAVRNTGAAAAAGWVSSDAQGLEVGPDGKLYFATAFGTPAGEGVFRLNIDGSGFERFIARSGSANTDGNAETPDETWELNNSRDLEWSGSVLYVSARGAFNATGRPVYKFDASGGFLGTLSSLLVAPQGLETDQDGLLVTGTQNGEGQNLVLLDTNGVPPVLPVPRAPAGVAAGLDVIDLNGDSHIITYNTGVGNSGQVFRRNFNGSFTNVVEALPGSAADFVIFLPSGDQDDYATWAEGHGLDPESPQGAPAGDADGDGTSNAVEFALDLDPKNGASRFVITTSGSVSAGLTLSWPSAEGVVFEVRSSTNLIDWSTLEGTVTGQPGQSTSSWTAPAAGVPASPVRKFYRVGFKP